MKKILIFLALCLGASVAKLSAQQVTVTNAVPNNPLTAPVTPSLSGGLTEILSSVGLVTDPTNYVQDQTSRNNLLSYLPGNYRNFYFFGHGNDSAIGSYNGFDLTLDQIAAALVNVPLSYSGPPELINIDPPIMVYPTVPTQIKTVANHPYRFVFIDACDTGAGSFCEAFGIPAMTVSTNYFKTLGVESRAFVGMKSWKLNLNFLTWQSYSAMTGWFLTDWLSGQVTVQNCVLNAQNDYHSSGAHMDSSAVIYGAYDLMRGTHTGQ